MTYLIDGHNLIPKVPGLSLQDIDDEMRLVERLQVFARLRRKAVEVFFDQAPAGYSTQRKYGQIKAYFARQGSTADEAIQARLSRLGKSARNVVVVSSDRQVQASARAAGATFVTAEAFAGELINLPDEPATRPDPDRLLSEEEIASWEELFHHRSERSSTGRSKDK